MGLFDNFIKQIDNGLKAVESGALEERLNKFADTIDKTSKQAETKLATVADKPEELLKTAAAKKDGLEATMKDVGERVKKNVNIVQR